MREESRPLLPRGTVTFLFTDIEGSTALLERVGTADYGHVLTEHRRVLREAFTRYGGVVVDTSGDGFFVAFPTAAGAVDAAIEAQRALADGPVAVRMGMHTGTPELIDDDYIGADVHRAARIAAAAHGGQILISDATAHLITRHDLRDLGEHRLRGFGEPGRLIQVGHDHFPPPRTAFQSHLPRPPTRFIGREREIAEIGELLSRSNVRLVTLTGTGGTGKTRLSVAVASAAGGRYSDGVWWVSLAELRDPTLVMESVARTLEARGDLAERIGDKSMLLVIDNFEHVMSAAADLARLVGQCPNLDVLVTSRAPLRVTGEHEYEVAPLASADAVALFVERAHAVRGGAAGETLADSTVKEICRRLDDLPLAIELAAARLKVMTAEQLLARLGARLELLTSGRRDEPDRHRTLRATIEWSYELLAPAEQALFAALSLFRGGSDLAATEAICDADLDAMQALVEQSLLRRRDDRFVMLETLREFAAEKLTHLRADDVAARHAAYYLSLAEEAEPHLFAFAVEWLDRLAVEHDNLRGALDRFESAGDIQGALRIAGALQRFWIVRGHLAEGGRRLRRLLEVSPERTAARAKALNGAALIALNTGDVNTAIGLADEALAIYRAVGSAWGEARSAFVRGFAAADQGDFDGAVERFEASFRAFEELGDESNVLIVASNLSWVYREVGQAERARELDEETLRRARAVGNDSMVALSLAGMAMTALDDGRPAEATAMLREALDIDRRLGDVRRSVDDMCRLSRALAASGHVTAAVELLAAAEHLHGEIGATVSPEVARVNAGTRSMIESALSPADQRQAENRGGAMSFADAFEAAQRVPAQGDPSEG